MSNTSLKRTLAALAGVVLSTAAAQAGVIGINTPGTSSTSIIFDDTGSFSPTGGLYPVPTVSPWNGSIQTLSTTTDPNGDFAQGSINATFSGNTYALNLSGITLSQFPVNSGYALLTFRFNVEFQLDALGLPAQPTLYPNFAVTGTVQPLGFASIDGFITYYDSSNTVIDQVNYFTVWNTPGPFTSTAFGTPASGNTPALAPNSTLTLAGLFVFKVDPATINAHSVAVPEPTGIAVGLLCLGLAAMRRR